MLHSDSFSCSDGDRRRLERNLLGRLPVRIEPVPLAPRYRVAVAGAAVATVLLPVLYFAMIAAIPCLLYFYAVEGWELIMSDALARSTVPRKWAALVFLMPFIVGIVTLSVLIKPLVTRRRIDRQEVEVDARQEPLLFGLVGRLCATVGAPLPDRIVVDCRVNASVERRPHPTRRRRSELVLTIGLPMVAGLDLGQVVGVLGHELGHLAQRSCLRLSSPIYRVHRWLVRAAREADRRVRELDQELAESRAILAMAILAMTTVTTRATRELLLRLRFGGLAIVRFMERQMELDADRYEARLVGSETFVETTQELSALSLARSRCLRALRNRPSALAAIDNFPRLVLAVRQKVSDEEAARVEAGAAARPRGLLDSHPVAAERMLAVRDEQARGPFVCELPGALLFRSFDELAARATRMLLD